MQVPGATASGHLQGTGSVGPPGWPETRPSSPCTAHRAPQHQGMPADAGVCRTAQMSYLATMYASRTMPASNMSHMPGECRTTQCISISKDTCQHLPCAFQADQHGPGRLLLQGCRSSTAAAQTSGPQHLTSCSALSASLVGMWAKPSTPAHAWAQTPQRLQRTALQALWDAGKTKRTCSWMSSMKSTERTASSSVWATGTPRLASSTCTTGPW